MRRLDETLPHLLKTLHKAGVAAVGVAALSQNVLGDEAAELADQLHIPLIYLPSSAQLEEIEREVITFVVNFRSEIERKATELTHQLMQLSLQGAGTKGLCEHLANSRGKWVIVQDAMQHVRVQAVPTQTDALLLPSVLSDDFLWQHGYTRVVEPIMIRHEVVGYISLVGSEDNFDYLERIILGQVAPILALEFARERERSEVETRYQVEAFTDVLQGHYQQPEEMLARARILDYDLTVPQVVVVFEIASDENEDVDNNVLIQWGRRVRDELLRVWPGCWLLGESRRVVALLPLFELEPGMRHDNEEEQNIYTRLERVYARLEQSRGNSISIPHFSCGIGRIADNLAGVSRSFREAQQSLEIGRRLFGDDKLHSFARLGIYRLLFYLDGHDEMKNFYQETLGPLLHHDGRNDNTLMETLEGYFHCNGNLSETARVMHLHRNSLLYRLGRIEEILGRSLEDPELRLSLQIALKIHHLIKRPS